MSYQRLIHRASAACLASTLLLLPASFLRAEIDPEDIKTKAPDIERSGKQHDPHDKLHEDLRADGETNLKKVLELMDKIQNDLSNKKTGSATQKEQRSLIKKLDKLIDKLGKG